MSLKKTFQPDYERYEVLRRVIVHIMRLGYLLVFVFVWRISRVRASSPTAAPGIPYTPLRSPCGQRTRCCR
jgi:hypothetical protein